MRTRDLPLYTIFAGLLSIVGCGLGLFLFDMEAFAIVPPALFSLPLAILLDRARVAKRSAWRGMVLYLFALAFGAVASVSNLLTIAAFLICGVMLAGLLASRLSRVHGAVVGLGADRVTIRTARDVLVSLPREKIGAASGFVLREGAKMSMLGWGTLGPSSVPFRREATIEFSPLLVRRDPNALTRGLLRHTRNAVVGLLALTIVGFGANIAGSLYFPGCAIVPPPNLEGFTCIEGTADDDLPTTLPEDL